MDIYSRIDCVVGDPFFFYAAENAITKILIGEYSLPKIEKEYVFSDHDVNKLNYALLPSIFDINPKLIILRNIKNKMIGPAVNSLYANNNTYLLIEIEAEQCDGRVKVFKELEKNKCIHNFGFAHYNGKNDNTLNIAFEKMSEILGIQINNDTKQVLINFVPKIVIDNKPIHNLCRIFQELQKAYYYDKNFSSDDLKQLLSYPSKYNSLFDITQALSDADMGYALEIIDTNVTDINEARNMINFILSELKIICQVLEQPSKQQDAIYKDLTTVTYHYDLLDDVEIKENKPIHPYRLKKILEKQNSDYFKNCYQYLALATETHNDLNYHYTNNFKIPLIKLCLQICRKYNNG